MKSIRTSIILMVHAIGVLNAISALYFIWNRQTLLSILFWDLGWFVLLVGVSAISIFGGIELGRAALRLKRRCSEQDFGLRLRVFLYFITSCVLIHVVFLTIAAPQFANINFVIAYGAYLLWWRMLPRLRRKVPALLGRGLDVAFMNLLVVLFLAEVGLRVIATEWPSPLLVTSATVSETRRAAQRYGPGTMHYGMPLNDGGHFDGPFLERSQVEGPLVVTIGDSFSLSVVPHPYHYTTVAEREVPGLSMYNMGYPALGPPDYQFLVSEEALPLKPDLIIVSLFIGNDLVEGRGRGAAPKVRWYDSERYLLSVLWTRVRVLIRDGRIDWRGRVRDAAPGSEQAGVAPDQTDTLEELVREYPWVNDPLLETATFKKELFLNIEVQRAQNACSLDESIYTDFYASLEKIVSAAKDVPIAFMLIPDEFQVEDALWLEIVGKSDRPLDQNRPQRKIVEWMEERGFPVLDLLPLLRKVAPLQDGRRHVFHLQDTHFNARGNEVAGKALAHFVTQVLAESRAVTTLARAKAAAASHPPPEQITPERAGEVVAAYGPVVEKFADSGGKALDISQLAHPKWEIQASLLLIWQLAAADSMDKRMMQAALMRLADFQEDVGPDPVALDGAGPNSARLRDLIAREREARAASMR